jgi:hypothetical protein
MSMKFNHHNDATDVPRSCHGTTPMASKVQGVLRDYPVRLRLKYRVHAPELGRGRHARS